LYFQTLDDKSECAGVYVAGKLHFDEIPPDLTKTWKYTGSIIDPKIEYAWLYANGDSLEKACPDELIEELRRIQRRFRAYLKSFKIGRINLREHCFFDLVPDSFLLEFCEIKNKITKHVFETYEKPVNYELLNDIQKLMHKIKYQNLNLNQEGCRELYYTSMGRSKANELLKKYNYIDYNMFGTVTGRLTTNENSFPILTVKREYRRLIKPHNNWFISLDYNGAEIRTFFELAGQEQPKGDVHEWNMKNIFEDEIDRKTAKLRFFAWFYNPKSNIIEAECYNREKILDKWYKEGYINTIYGRKIQVDKRKAFNYLIQSTTSDRVLSRAVKIDKFLDGKKSFISHIIHDEIVIDFSDDERIYVPEIKKIFEEGDYKVNVNAGKNCYDFEELKI